MPQSLAFALNRSGSEAFFSFKVAGAVGMQTVHGLVGSGTEVGGEKGELFLDFISAYRFRGLQV